MFRNFATGRTVSGSALTIGLLDYFSGWKSADDLIRQSRIPHSTLRKAIAVLHRASILQRSGDALSPAEARMDQWASWNPAAGFFHFSTKDVRFASKANADRLVRERAAARPVPEPLKRARGRTLTRLPTGIDTGGFEEVLNRRRTWRRFGNTRISIDELATLLRMTFGAQRWVDLGAAGRAMLRTSPSAGARHPLEAYVVVRHVSRLKPGIYHYRPNDHQLAHIGEWRSRFDRYLPAQVWYRRAAALVLITAVFARTEWKYPFPRAYRTILLEAGHFAQTFCLTATALALAPFCTAALADSVIEKDLGLDGVSESVIYACGVGTRPPGVDWAPWPDTSETPQLFPPVSAKISRKR